MARYYTIRVIISSYLCNRLKVAWCSLKDALGDFLEGLAILFNNKGID